MFNRFSFVVDVVFCTFFPIMSPMSPSKILVDDVSVDVFGRAEGRLTGVSCGVSAFWEAISVQNENIQNIL